MATKYTEYKKRSFKLRKDAAAWAKAEKERVAGSMTLKVDINFLPNQELAYEAVLLVKE